MPTTATKRRILVVDDEASFTRMMQCCLEDTGRYEVRAVHGGADALAAARQFRPDLILLDVIMPDVDGSMVAAEFRNDPALQAVPVIFLTAIISRDEVGSSERAIGGQVFIAKPASIAAVTAAIEKHLANKGAEAADPCRRGVL